MKMKKTLMAALLAAIIGMMGVQHAEARDEGPHENGPGYFHKLDDATKAKIAKFRAENQDLHKQIAMKRAEKSALIRSETPNIEAVKKAAGELFDLKAAMYEKVKAAGLFTSERHGRFAERHAKLEIFLEDTKDLRRQIYVQRAEQRAMLHSKNPDSMAVAKVAGELFDLQNTLREKARAAGLPGYFHRGHGRNFSHEYDHGLMV
jgi:hypothetical protein